uniref:PPM-type phosphatase domain-containing protein n=1 Tax=Alexandrium andersonii TaxID=327968 RepID=A0A7S2DD03_9DINO|mmetsp:Transcript_51548/g.116638  ORF Transcript_51548/g.116638 Transcript_51548/m.116638 type:complete len:451 (+) Transcript_51548:73-1425(+)
MADKDDLKSDNEIGSGSDGETKQFMRGEMDTVGKWGAKGVSVDPLMLEGRRANRGFTIAMGKADAGSAMSDIRRDKRAQTLPSMGSRRGDFALSEASLKVLTEQNEKLAQRFRRGSTAVSYTVVPEEELKRCWTETTSCLLFGKMTEGQSASDERLRTFVGGDDKLPGTMPPVISCTKGSKGFRDTTPNQDNFSVTFFKNGYTFACCMDGHGPFGHMVSTRSVQTVPYYLITSEHFPDNIEGALVEAFERAQKEVVASALQGGWDVQASGSTAVAALWKGTTIWTANVGDSRCVIGYESNRKMVFETEDHKPNHPKEQERIHDAGGEVRSQTYPDGWVNHRIFVKGQDYPGLCMTRTLGDESVKAHGVIATPEVKKTEVDLSQQPFFILASDGVWEFLDSEFVVKAVAKKIQSDGPDRTVQKLQREARKRWRNEEGDYCDDITSILVQLR